MLDLSARRRMSNPATPSRETAPPRGWRGWLSAWFVVILGLATFWFAIRVAGPIAPAANLALTLITAWSFLELLVRDGAGRGIAWAARAAPLAILAGSRMATGDGEIGAVLGVLLVMGVATHLPGRSLAGYAGRATAWSVGAGSLLWLLTRHSAVAFMSLDWVSGAVCTLARLIIGVERDLGPTNGLADLLGGRHRARMPGSIRGLRERAATVG